MNFKPAQLNSNSCHKWKSSKNVDSFVYLGSEISSTDKKILKSGLQKLGLPMKVIWKSTLPKNLKRSFFRAAVESIYSSIWISNLGIDEKSWKNVGWNMYPHVLGGSTQQRLNCMEPYQQFPPSSKKYPYGTLDIVSGARMNWSVT